MSSRHVPGRSRAGHPGVAGRTEPAGRPWAWAAAALKAAARGWWRRWLTRRAATGSVPAMTAKLVVLYTQPTDPEAFERHYLSTHMPLAAAMPGLIRAETGKFAAAPAGAQPYYRAAELWFADQAALNAAFASAEGKAAAADYGQIAPEGSIMLVQELDD
jgi:uncharacterized protein (TIGR02118 family)